MGPGDPHGPLVGEPWMSIPLYRPDLTEGDSRAVLDGGPLRDLALLARWEEGWRHHWQRPCVVFADPADLWRALRQVMGWRPGHAVAVDPFLRPLWWEAMAQNGLAPEFPDVDPLSGAVLARDGGLVFQRYGMAVAGDAVLEDLSSVVIPGAGSEGLWLLHFQGILHAGGCCLIASRDETLTTALRQSRHRWPGAAVCRLGLFQLTRLGTLLQRRRALIRRYHTVLREGRGCHKLPQPIPWWGLEWYLLRCDNQQTRDDLADFLARGGIGAASPIWYRLPGALPGALQFQHHTLALPLYAALTDGEQKRVINRYHRWRQRGGGQSTA